MNDRKVYLQYTVSTMPLPDFIFEGLKEYSREAKVYHPQPDCLVRKLATKFQMSEDYFCLTGGADEAI